MIVSCPQPRRMSLNERRERRAQRDAKRMSMGDNLPVIKIPWNKEFSEFEIHSVLYSQLLIAGAYVRGEVKCAKTDIFRGSRLDIVVYNEKKRAVLIIEVKADYGEPDVGVNQVERYKEKHRLPVKKVVGMSQALDLVNIIKSGLLVEGVRVYLSTCPFHYNDFCKSLSQPRYA